MVDTNPDGGFSPDVFIMEDRLTRIRGQVNSKLENQKQLAIILNAVEENMDEQNSDKTPTAYFVSFLSLLDQSVRDGEIKDSGLATSAVYFIDIVAPYTPRPLLVAKFGDILTKLATPLTANDVDNLLVRSTIGALESLLVAQDYSKWTSSNEISPKRAMVGLLELGLDPRPKIRKRAQEAIGNILSQPPTSPQPIHIASSLCGELTLQRLKTIVSEHKLNNKETNSQVIHCLQLITAITSSNSWPPKHIEPLCDALLEISKTNDQFLVSSAFSAFEGLFQSMTNIIDVDKFAQVVNILFDLKPSINDVHLAASWLAVVAKACESYSQLDAQPYIGKLNTIIPTISQFLGSDSSDIYSSASHCLVAIVEAIPTDYLLLPTKTNGITAEIYETMDEVISFIAEHIEQELLSIKYQPAFRVILLLINEVILKFRSRANPDFLGIIETIGEWRTNETEQFPYNKEAEDVLASSISVMGPEVVLGVLPLNLDQSNKPGRAWLLPLLRDNVRGAHLEFYKKTILPLVKVFEDRINKMNKDSVHVKIFQTIVDQIWSLLPHFCDLPKDLVESFDDSFAAQLTDLMYSNVESRVTMCHALRLLVESNKAYSEGVLADDLLLQQEFPIEKAQSNMEYLSTKAVNILSVLFNVFSSTAPESRGFVLETIDTYLQIVSKEELQTTFNKVSGLLKNAMDEEQQQHQQQGQQQKKDSTPQLSITMMDLIVCMAKYIPESSYNALFSIFSTTVNSTNGLMQKRAFKVLIKLGETESGKQSIIQFASEIVNVLINTIESTHNSARTARLTAINTVVKLLPQQQLYLIPAVLQEIIMSTKDVNERTRSSSYQILVTMGYKMEAGGIIHNSKVPGFEDDTPDSEANLIEYFTMVSGGLAAQSPHMISATITALSCIMFEFKDKIPTETMVEICSTVELFLTHNSREIAKSAIGFVKVEVLSLPEDMVRSNLSELLGKLMRWSHEHKGHFKSKVKHIVERLIRKFGIDDVEHAMPEEDKKLVTNIRKTRNRAKRKQKEEQQDGDKQVKKFVSAYEEALYDSEGSEDEEEEEQQQQPQKHNKGNKNRSNKESSQFIMESNDSPVDLLDRQALANISSSKPSNMAKKDMAQKMHLQTKNGKFVFNENQGDDLDNKGSGIDAYLDAVKQQPIRGQRNRLKFKQKNNGDDFSDDEEETSRPQRKPQTNKSRISKPKPKQKFKAKKKL